MLEDCYIRDWYTDKHHFDDLGQEIDYRASFADLLIALVKGEDVYKVIGVGDSIIRERCFEKLSEMLGVGYEFVYNMWLDGGRKRKEKWKVA